jgi:hypothetical protein
MCSFWEWSIVKIWQLRWRFSLYFEDIQARPSPIKILFKSSFSMPRQSKIFEKKISEPGLRIINLLVNQTMPTACFGSYVSLPSECAFRVGVIMAFTGRSTYIILVFRKIPSSDPDDKMSNLSFFFVLKNFLLYFQPKRATARHLTEKYIRFPKETLKKLVTTFFSNWRVTLCQAFKTSKSASGTVDR